MNMQKNVIVIAREWNNRSNLFWHDNQKEEIAAADKSPSRNDNNPPLANQGEPIVIDQLSNGRSHLFKDDPVIGIDTDRGGDQQ